MRSRPFLFFLLSLIIFFLIFYLVCFYSFFQIKEIEVSGNQKVSTGNIKNLIEINFPKTILFSNSKSIFLADLEKVREETLNQFPQIKGIEFDRDFPSKLMVLIEEREPVAIIEREEGSFFLDSEGIAFDKVSEESSWALTVVRDESLDELRLGSEVIEKKKLSQILEIESGLRKTKIKTILAEVINHQRVNIKTLEGWDIYFDLRDDISQQIFNLSLVLKEKISPEKRGNLEYVDLRFGNQVYYK